MNAGTEDDTKRLLPTVFVVSAAVIGWQLALMRCLLISRYHHFSFLVISCALLGFGGGGVLLCPSEKMVRTPLSFNISMGDIVIRHFIANLFLARRTIPS